MSLNAFTVHLADELRDTKIKVNSADPGWVKTDMGGAGADLEIMEGGKTSAQLATLSDDGPTGGFFHLGPASTLVDRTELEITAEFAKQKGPKEYVRNPFLRARERKLRERLHELKCSMDPTQDGSASRVKRANIWLGRITLEDALRPLL